LQKLALLYNVEEFDLFNDNLEDIALPATLSGFGTDELCPSDERQVARFKKIVSNYLKMVKALEKE